MKKARIEHVGFPIYMWLVSYENVGVWFATLDEAVDYAYTNYKIPVYIPAG